MPSPVSFSRCNDGFLTTNNITWILSISRHCYHQNLVHTQRGRKHHSHGFLFMPCYCTSLSTRFNVFFFFIKIQLDVIYVRVIDNKFSLCFLFRQNTHFRNDILIYNFFLYLFETIFSYFILNKNTKFHSWSFYSCISNRYKSVSFYYYSSKELLKLIYKLFLCNL